MEQAARKAPARESQPVHRKAVRAGRSVEITRNLRERVRQAARDLFASGDGREISAVIAKREGISQVVVDRILTGLMVESDTAAAMLRTGVRNALDLSDQAGAEVWRNCA